MKVNTSQIQELYIFTRQHFVEHYDLQTELVDHLSNGIEAQWQENPSLSFNEALNREFKKFGVFGFQDVITERVKAMEKRYLAIIWRFFKDYLTFPKAALTIFLMALCYTLLRTIPSNTGVIIVFGVYFLMILWMFFKVYQFRKQLRNKEKRWLLEDMIFSQMGYVNVGILPLHVILFGFDSDSLQSGWVLILISVGLPCLCLFFYTATNIIPQKAEELLEAIYPEYKIV